ncbi:uncharacterized protein LOC111616070 [Centruroides sculpturatus]|uniref:uncharacterized protein LOC111616070 n=1 Tax=Centruroides sculpturatus TaxID=218467 RepID=UPI000C6CB84A|nr:uncharacterized protein LOC111616070 [Centruroides sculpturatus]
MNSLIHLDKIKKFTDEEEIQLSTYGNRWKSLAMSMKFLGLKLEKRFTPHIIFMLIAAKIFAIYFIYKNIILLTNYSSSLVNWMIFAYYLFRLSINVFLLYHFHLNKKKIMSKLNDLYEVSGISREISNKSRSMLIKVCIIWFSSIVTNIVNYLIITKKKFKFNSTKQIFHTNFDDYRGDIIEFLPHFVSSVTITLQFYFLLLHFSSICKDFEYSFVLVRKKLVDNCNPKEIKAASFKYMQISGIINDIENIYSPVLFLWSTLIVGNVIFSIGHHLQNVMSFTLSDMIILFYFYGVQFLLFSDICFSSSNMNREAKTFAMSLYKSSLSIDDPAIQQFAFRFSVEILQDLPNFSAWNMFYIDNNLTMTIFSAVVTYGLVMYQFSRKE